MSILIQRNRILVNDFDESRIENFIKKNTVFNKKITFGYEELWVGIKDIVHEGEKYFALPREYPIELLHKYLNEEPEIIKDTKYHIPYKTVDISLKDGVAPRTELQVELTEFLSGTDRYKDINRMARRALLADTGEGKTFLTINYIVNTKLFTVILCPDDRAIKTWVDEFVKFTDVSLAEIGIVKGADNLERIIKKKDNFKVVLVSSRTLSSLFKNKKDDEVLNFFEKMEFGLKVIDEIHLGLETTFNVEMTISTFRTFYLTATASKRVWGEQVILDNILPSGRCTYQQELVRKFEFIEVEYYSNCLKEHQKNINKPNGFDALVYLKMLTAQSLPYFDMFCKDVLRKAVKYSIKQLSYDRSKIAVLCKTNEAGEMFGKYLAQTFPDLSIGYFNSKIARMADRELELEKDIIISTDKSFAGIINIKGLEVIVNLTPITSKSHILQIAGRLRREEDKRRIFLQLADFSFKKARNMMYRERKIMEEVSISVDRVVLNKAIHVVEEE